MLENRLMPHGEKLSEYAARLELTRDDSSPGWLNDLKFSAAEVIKEKGFPHAKLESWEFSQVRKVLADTYSGLDPAFSRDQIREAMDEPLARTGVPSLVFVNGGLDPELSDGQDLPEGLRLIPLSELEQYPDVHDWVRRSCSVRGEEKFFKGLNLQLPQSYP